MTAHLHADTSSHRHADFVARLDFSKRVRELETLAQEERIALPMPAKWIATLEALGYVVDLATGDWTDAEGVAYMPTDKALQLDADGALKDATL